LNAQLLIALFEAILQCSIYILLKVCVPCSIFPLPPSFQSFTPTPPTPPSSTLPLLTLTGTASDPHSFPFIDRNLKNHFLHQGKDRQSQKWQNRLPKSQLRRFHTFSRLSSTLIRTWMGVIFNLISICFLIFSAINRWGFKDRSSKSSSDITGDRGHRRHQSSSGLPQVKGRGKKGNAFCDEV
jgi:hypothetical protein